LGHPCAIDHPKRASIGSSAAADTWWQRPSGETLPACRATAQLDELSSANAEEDIR